MSGTSSTRKALAGRSIAHTSACSICASVTNPSRRAPSRIIGTNELSQYTASRADLRSMLLNCSALVGPGWATPIRWTKVSAVVPATHQLAGESVPDVAGSAGEKNQLIRRNPGVYRSFALAIAQGNR